MFSTTNAGQLDPTFATQGRFSHSAYVRPGPIHLLETSQNLLISAAPTDPAKELRMMRLTPEGTLDASFGKDGLAKLDYEEALEFYPTSIITDEKGHIYVVGDWYNAVETAHPIVFRLLADGKPDLDFGENDKPYRIYDSITSAGSVVKRKRALLDRGLVKQQPQGSEGIAGIWNDTLYFMSGNHILAIHLDGKLATEFNGTGYWLAMYEGNAVPLGTMSHREGRIYAALAPSPFSAQDHVVITCLDEHGKVDTAFANNGYLKLTTPGHTSLPEQITWSPRNPWFFLACATNDWGTALMSFNSAGTLNDAFNEGKPVFLEKPANAMAAPSGIALGAGTDKEEKVYLAVSYESEELGSPLTTLRFNSDGTLDKGYGDNGWAFVGEDGEPFRITCQHNGQPLLASRLKLVADPISRIYVTRLRA